MVSIRDLRVSLLNVKGGAIKKRTVRTVNLGKNDRPEHTVNYAL